MKRSFTLLTLFAASLTTSLAARADSISFGSIVGSTTYTYQSGQGLLNGTSGNAVGYSNNNYATALAGSQWLSTSILGGDGAIGITNFTDQINLAANETYTGTLSFLADDTAGVLINGVQVYALSSGANYSTPTTINLLSSYFKSGVNTITIQDSNTSFGTPAAVDFAGSVTGVAPTPEPSSLILLGTGILGGAVLARYSMRKAS